MLASLGASILWLGTSLHANRPGCDLYYRIRAYDAMLSSAPRQVQGIVRVYCSGRVNIMNLTRKSSRSILKPCNAAEIEALRLVYVIVLILAHIN